MADRIRIIPHEAVPLRGSFEVRFPDGPFSVFLLGRHTRPAAEGRICSQASKRCATQRTLAKSEQNKLEAAN
jgi:hypothetical protein